MLCYGCCLFFNILCYGAYWIRRYNNKSVEKYKSEESHGIPESILYNSGTVRDLEFVITGIYSEGGQLKLRGLIRNCSNKYIGYIKGMFIFTDNINIQLGVTSENVAVCIPGHREIHFDRKVSLENEITFSEIKKVIFRVTELKYAEDTKPILF